MERFLAFFRHAPDAEEIKSPQEVQKLYGYWRIRILYSMFVGYALYYFTRKSFTFAMPGLIEDLGFDKGQLGLLGSIFAISYGVSKFASGILSDQSNPRYFMAAGLFLTGVFNIFFGMSSSLLLFSLFWGLNGWFQGFGWPPCARFLTHWYSHSERGAWWSTWNISHNVGAFVIPWIVGAALQYWGWRYAMYVPGMICIFGAFFLVNRLRDTPQSLGLPPIERFRGDYSGQKSAESFHEEQPSVKEVLIQVVSNRYLWILAAAYFFVYVVRTGVNDWTALYLREERGYSLIGANGCVSLFEIGGLVGSLCAGWASDKLFGARRGPVNALFAGIMGLGIALFWWVPEGFAWLNGVALFCIGFAVFGPQMMIGMAAAELAHKKAASTSTGFVGTFAYIGAAVAGYPLGRVTQEFGWEGFFIFLLVCCAVSTLFLIPMWNVTESSVRLKSQKIMA